MYFIGFLTIGGLLGFSVYLQLFQGIQPCALCTLQRLTFAFLGAAFLFGSLFARNRILQHLVNTLIFIISGLGIFLAGRQIWLQHFPSTDGTECGVSIQYMLQVLPWHEVLQRIIAGSTECSVRGWELLSLNMAEWALIWFVFFLFSSIYLFVQIRKSR
jgi:disulfide bond formation protein DsbB